MPRNYDSIKRDGGNKLIQLAKVLCRLVQTFAVVLRGKYGDNVAVMALLTAIEALCPLIPEAEFALVEYSGDNDTPLNDPSEILGTDPSAPPPPTLT